MGPGCGWLACWRDVQAACRVKGRVGPRACDSWTRRLVAKLETSLGGIRGLLCRGQTIHHHHHHSRTAPVASSVSLAAQFRCCIEPRATKTTGVVRHFDWTINCTSHCSVVRVCVFLESLVTYFSHFAIKIKTSVEAPCNSCTSSSYSLLRLIWQVESCCWLPCWCSEVPLAIIAANKLFA